MMLVSTISYVDRNTLALLIPTIQAETGMTALEYGRVASAFSFAYMLGNPAWGYLLDRVGVRIGMTAAVALWTLASGAHAWATGLASFALLRILLGFGEGATFPGGLRTVVQTLPPEQRARGTALAYSGGSFGAIITPILMTPVAAAGGWRGAFLFTALIGFVWIAWWWMLSRRPELQHAAVVRSGTINFRDVRLWGALASYSMGAVPLGFVLYNGALYLRAVFQLSQQQIGALLWIPPLGWELGYFFWGWLCDRFGPRSYRVLMGIACVFSLPLVAAPRMSSLTVLMLELFLAMFMTSGFIIPSIQYATRIVPAGATSLVAGMGAGSYSLLTALTAPLFGYLFDQRAYPAAFLVAAVFPVAGYTLFLWSQRKAG